MTKASFIPKKLGQKSTRNVLVALQFMHRTVVGILQENFEWIPHAAANVLDRIASMAAVRTHEESFRPHRSVVAVEYVTSFPRYAARAAAHCTHFLVAVGLHLENEAHLTNNAVIEGNGRGLHSDEDRSSAAFYSRAKKN
jgi:hypothetical protein